MQAVGVAKYFASKSDWQAVASTVYAAGLRVGTRIARVLSGLVLTAILARTASAATPPVAVKNLTAWYDASDASTIQYSTSPSVAHWTDKSGSGNTLSQAGSSNQPSAASVNGHAALTFSGSAFLTSSTMNTYATGSAPGSTFIVAAYSGGATDGTSVLLDYGQATALNDRAIRKKSGSLIAFATLAGGNDVVSNASWGSTPTLVYAQFGPSATSVNVNGGSLTSANYVPATTASTSLYLGQKQGGGGFYWVGNVYETLMYNAALTTTEQQFIEGYLACKWGFQASLPAAHPYYSSCPTTATPTLSVALGVVPAGLQSPGTDLAYTSTFTNASGTLIYSPVISDPIPAHTWFKVGTAGGSMGGTGLSLSLTYSNDGGTTYAYTPTSGGGGAAAGYDALVTNVRWSLGGSIGPAPSINSGTVTYTVRII